MKRTYFNFHFFICFLLQINAFGQAQEIDNALEQLRVTIQESKKYDALKLKKIDSLQQILHKTKDDKILLKHDLNEKLYQEFEVFKYDSAFIYAVATRKIAQQLKDKTLIANSKNNLGAILVASGMHKEALDTLQTIRPSDLSQSKRARYYNLLGRCYQEMAELVDIPFFNDKYRKHSAIYFDSAAQLATQGTVLATTMDVVLIRQKGELDKASDALFTLLSHPNMSRHDSAITNSTLGEIFLQKNKRDSAIIYLARATQDDIKSSTKETAAIIFLANLLFEIGDIKSASTLIRKANEDAVFYGTRHRKIQIAEILPFIEEEVIHEIEQQKQLLLRRSLIVSALLLVVFILMIIVYRQLAKLKKTNNLLDKAHLQEKKINEALLLANRTKEEQNHQLKKVNALLLEANKIKEEYVGYFFSKDSDLFEKFKKFKTKIDKKLKEGNLSEAQYISSSYNLKEEKKESLKIFDQAFIKLFPDFINEFNSLFPPEAQIQLKEGQILNRELRIFALIRLGITGNEKIAQILGYSINSIYSYKTKVRNKSWVSNEDFERKLIKITTLKQ